MSAADGQLSFSELEPQAPPEPPPDEAPDSADGAGTATPPRAFEPTAEQAAAIAARERDAFLEAGAGSGKTTVLVDRYCAAVADDGVEVDRVLAFTFTERAAAEMRSRVRRDLMARERAVRESGDEARADELRRSARATERAWVMTIHAFCRRLLAQHPLAAGLDPRFRVLDASEATRLADRASTEALEALLAAGDQDVLSATAAYQPWRLSAMTMQAHSRLRSQGMSEPRLPPVPDPVHSPGRKEEERALTADELEAARSARRALELLLEAFGTRYAELKDERSALDFQDLELRALELLESSPVLAQAWNERFTHVMVDEFQDTNSVQLRLVEMLSGPGVRTFMVGDEHQSIYRFRNADLEVFRGERRAAREASDRDVLPLLGNFRSRPAVLAAVNEIGRTLLDGFAELTAGRQADGAGSVELLLTLDEGRARDARKWAQEEIDLEPPPAGSPARMVAEARFLAQRLRELVDAKEAERGEIVVLLRAFTHVDAYEEALKRAGLRPFVVGGRGYWTQQQVEDLVRLLGVVANPLDDEHLFGALASFANAVSPDALWLLRRAATDEAGFEQHVWPVVEWRFGGGREPAAHDDGALDAIEPDDAAKLERFCRTLAGLRAQAALLTIEELIEATMNAFGYDLGLIAREGGAGRMANVRKLMRLARDYEANEGRDLAGFLALAIDSTQRDEREGMAAVQAEGHDGVRVMTVHAAKGLEFGVVAVPDLGRELNAGHSHSDITIGSPSPDGSRRFGMRLVFPARKHVGLWELVDLNYAESEAEAEEGCRLVYVAASRARDRLILSGAYKPTDLEPIAERKPNDTPLRRLLPALAERGFANAEGEIELPAPRPVQGGDPQPATTRLAIRISEPGPKRAAELVRSFAAPEEETPLAGEAAGPPPLLDEGPAPVPVGHLSYSALALYEQCGYRFYVERVLGARETLTAAPGDAGEEAPEIPAEMPEPGVSRGHALGIGNAVHGALEWSAAHAWEPPTEELVAGLLAREGLGADGEALGRARRLVAGWLESGLRRDLGTGVRPEVPFVLGLADTVVRGQIDLLAAGSGDDVPTVVDYKTDALAGRSPAELAARYSAQRQVYALATGAEHGARTIHVFLEAPDEPQIEVFDRDGLAAAREHLGGLIDRMRGGDFEVTHEPYAALCFACPAAARLCPRPAWKPPRP
jgi:ATP-dependent exoDNAse (exonuclease V) beta subunit